MVKKSKSKSKSKKSKKVQETAPEVVEEVLEVVEEVVEEVPETTNEKTNVQDETPELNFSNLYERMEAINKQMKDLDRERRNIFKQLSRVHTKEVKAARKNRRSGNSNRGSKEPSGFNRPQPVPKEFTVEPWNCDKDEELPRTVLTKKVYDYVKGKGLQDPADKRIIHPDSTLKKLFHLKKGQNIEFKTFQTFMARLYKGETVSEGEGDEEENVVEEVVEKPKEKKKKKKKKNKTAVAL
jgi:hypothetical protein